MTIDQMIAAGLPWEQIKARINQLQAEQKEIAKRAAAAEKVKKQEIEEKEIEFLSFKHNKHIE